jgi:hypothetical protein
MRYCPYCKRVNLGSPKFCNYCGKTWYLRICPKGHENAIDAGFCRLCGSSDLSTPSGSKPTWKWLPRCLSWIILILCIIFFIENHNRFLSLLLNLLFCICLLLAGYFLISSFAPNFLIGVFKKVNHLVGILFLRILAVIWKVIRWFLIG